MTPRTRWQGWTLVRKNGGLLVIGPFERTPLIFPSVRQAKKEKNAEERVVRCEVRVIP